MGDSIPPDSIRGREEAEKALQTKDRWEEHCRTQFLPPTSWPNDFLVRRIHFYPACFLKLTKSPTWAKSAPASYQRLRTMDSSLPDIWRTDLQTEGGFTGFACVEARLLYPSTHVARFLAGVYDFLDTVLRVIVDAAESMAKVYQTEVLRKSSQSREVRRILAAEKATVESIEREANYIESSGAFYFSGKSNGLSRIQRACVFHQFLQDVSQDNKDRAVSRVVRDITEVRAEIRKLVTSSRALELQFRDISHVLGTPKGRMESITDETTLHSRAERAEKGETENKPVAAIKTILRELGVSPKDTEELIVATDDKRDKKGRTRSSILALLQPMKLSDLQNEWKNAVVMEDTYLCELCEAVLGERVAHGVRPENLRSVREGLKSYTDNQIRKAGFLLRGTSGVEAQLVLFLIQREQLRRDGPRIEHGKGITVKDYAVNLKDVDQHALYLEWVGAVRSADEEREATVTAEMTSRGVFTVKGWTPRGYQEMIRGDSREAFSAMYQTAISEENRVGTNAGSLQRRIEIFLLKEEDRRRKAAEAASIGGLAPSRDSLNQAAQKVMNMARAVDENGDLVGKTGKQGVIERNMDEFGEAAARVGVRKVLRLVREPLVAFLAVQATEGPEFDAMSDEEKDRHANSMRRQVAKILSTEGGEAALKHMIAVGWEFIKQWVPENYHYIGEALARELRIQAKEVVVDSIASLVEEHVIPILKSLAESAGEKVFLPPKRIAAPSLAEKVRVSVPKQAQETEVVHATSPGGVQARTNGRE